MKIGFVGLGKMGGAMAQRLRAADFEVVAFDPYEPARIAAAAAGISVAPSLKDMVISLKEPRIVWLMTPPGEVTEAALRSVGASLDKGDLLVDGGNSDFRDTRRRRELLAARGVSLVDAGVSGGVNGAKNGCGLLVGATQAQFDTLKPVFEALAAPGAYSLVGGAGSGHFAKAVHNGVEYAIMQAYGEGYELLAASDMDVDVLGVMEAWQAGCSVRSYLLEKMVAALSPDPHLATVKGNVADSGMGRWTLEEAIRLRVPTPTIAAALQARFRSQQDDSPTMKSIAALRGVIGGHAVPKA